MTAGDPHRRVTLPKGSGPGGGRGEGLSSLGIPHVMGFFTAVAAMPTAVMLSVYFGGHGAQGAREPRAVVAAGFVLGYFATQGWLVLGRRGLPSRRRHHREALQGLVRFHALWCWTYALLGIAGAGLLYVELLPFRALLIGLGALTALGILLNLPVWVRYRVCLDPEVHDG